MVSSQGCTKIVTFIDAFNSTQIEVIFFYKPLWNNLFYTHKFHHKISICVKTLFAI